tara:strand:- start:17845 stop:18978 length:1134 start_codon:yes stop_codon:yes gene_type:complete
MKISLTCIAILLLTNCKNEIKLEKEMVKNITNYAFYVGTYTEKDSKGIYKYVIEADGNLKKIGLAAKSENPSYLALSPNKKYVLAVNEVNKDNVGFVKSYAILNDSLKLISTASSGGAHPCFVGVNKNGYVITANYTGGNIGLLHLKENGGLSDILDVQQHVGKGTTDRQEAPHAHSAWFEKNNDNNVIVADLGTNELWFSTIDSQLNKLVPAMPNKLGMAQGAGPRHIAFNPDKSMVYVLNELDNTITLISKLETGEYKKISSVSTLPKEYTDYSKSADIHISKDGKFLYASNRGHNSIAIFGVNNENGSLTPLGYEPTKGENPRNFSLTPDDSYLVVANQDSDNIISFKRNVETGLLSYVSEIKAPTPVCILFAE